jgi:hypothetical protein
MRTAVVLLVALLLIYVLFSGKGVRVWEAISS